jgi:hypothetical protein
MSMHLGVSWVQKVAKIRLGAHKSIREFFSFFFWNLFSLFLSLFYLLEGSKIFLMRQIFYLDGNVSCSPKAPDSHGRNSRASTILASSRDCAISTNALKSIIFQSWKFYNFLNHTYDHVWFPGFISAGSFILFIISKRRCHHLAVMYWCCV